MTDRDVPQNDGRFSTSPPGLAPTAGSVSPAAEQPLTLPAATTALAPEGTVPDEAARPASPDSSSRRSPPPPTISPLFTLVTNVTRGTTHHPRIHYIFSDDDPDVLHQALAQRHVSPPLPLPTPADDGRLSSPAPPSTDRAVVLDLVPTGDGSWDVSWASSLSPDWAVVDSRISRAEEGHHPQARRRQHAAAAAGPADDGDDSEGEKTLMLQIEGVERERPPATMLAAVPRAAVDNSGSDILRSSAGSAGPSTSAAWGREDPAVLVNEFRKKMGMIRRVVNVGEERVVQMELARRAEEGGGKEEEEPEKLEKLEKLDKPDKPEKSEKPEKPEKPAVVGGYGDSLPVDTEHAEG